MSVYNYETLKNHANHEVEIVTYGPSSKEILNIALECNECNETLVSFDDDGDEEAIGETKCDYWALRAHLNHRLICGVDLSDNVVSVDCLDCIEKVLKFTNDESPASINKGRVSETVEYLKELYQENVLSLDEIVEPITISEIPIKNLSIIELIQAYAITIGEIEEDKLLYKYEDGDTINMANMGFTDNKESEQFYIRTKDTLPFVCPACNAVSGCSDQALKEEKIKCPNCAIHYDLSESQMIHCHCCGKICIHKRGGIKKDILTCSVCKSWFKEVVDDGPEMTTP